MTYTVYLSLGTNLGDRRANLQAALEAMQPKVRPLEESPIYETEPWGYEDQPDFLNQVVRAETELAPRQLLNHLKEVEEQVGREPTFRYGPRLLDIDILFYQDWIVDEPDLAIPHPHLHQRAFVLVPLADLAPDFRHPSLSRTVLALLQDVDTRGVKRLQSSGQ